MISTQIRDAIVNASEASVVFTDKTGIRFNTLEELREWAFSVETDSETVKKMAVAAWLRDDPSASQLAIKGKKLVTIDVGVGVTVLAEKK